MQLVLRRAQRTTRLRGKHVFTLDARLDLTREEANLVHKFQLDQYLVYDSAARTEAADTAAAHARNAAETARGGGSMGRALLSLGRAYLVAARAKLTLRITVGSLVRGHHIECKDLEELLGAESAIRDAANNVSAYLQVAETFDGREEVIELSGPGAGGAPSSIEAQPEPLATISEQREPPAPIPERQEPILLSRPAQ